MSSKPSGEFALIDWIRDRASTNDQVVAGIGDDCAVIQTAEASTIVVTTDMLMEGRHFILADAGAEAVGRKALGANLSDIAAMAARPIAAFVAVSLPKTNAKTIAEGIFQGMDPLARRFGLALAGGDTNVWDGPLVVCLTILGATADRGAVLRSGAKPGDVVFLTGPLGGSLLGRHLDPQPRIDEARAILDLLEPHAMIDVSDGLSADLNHILDESGGLGATLDLGSIPIHDDARRLAERDGIPPWVHALNDGEDFELCLTVSDEDARKIEGAPFAGPSLVRIGTIEARPGLRLRIGDGSLVEIEPRGFDHFDRF